MTIAVLPSILSLAMALIATAVGQLLFKLHYRNTGRYYLYLALGTFVIIPVFTYLALMNLSLATVYMSTAITNVLVLLMSRAILKEKMTARQIKSAALIVAGIVVFNL